ncbi:MAG: Hsp20/alpha crystallin family protein [Proteobacteria bacterium]|nr:Hsp20/alpha crystallin family protein [Pseudomonadota bacterium]
MNIELWKRLPLKTGDDDLDLFRHFGSGDIEFLFGETPTLGYPAVEVRGDNKNYYLEAETPGLTEKELEVVIEDGVLTLKGERKTETEKKEGKVHRTERYYGYFSRSFGIPEDVKTEEITAFYENGVLKLTLPKGEEAKPKRVEIKIN